MEAELPAERRGSSPCRLWRWPKGPGLTRVGPSETMIIGCRGHLVAFIEIAFISILSRRLVRLVTQETSA